MNKISTVIVPPRTTKVLMTDQPDRKAPETVLVVDDDMATLDCLVEAVHLLGLAVVSASDGETACGLFDQKNPCLVVTDVRMPRMDGLALTEHVKSRSPECPVIMITGHGDEATAIAALKAGASDYLRKPFQLSELRAAIHRALSLIRARLVEARSCVALERAQYHLVLKNEPEMVGGLLTLFLRPVEFQLSEADKLHVRVALQELLINAIEHGNLGISTVEKSEAVMNDTYEDLIRNRRQDPRYGRRRVNVRLSHDTDRQILQCTICDEGEGFDWQPFLNATPGTLVPGAGSGRGLFLVKTLVPDVAYNAKGNEVTVTFRHSRK